MPVVARSQKKSRAVGSARAAGDDRRDEDRLISRIRGMVAEAKRLADWHSGAQGGTGRDRPYDFRRRVLLLRQETEALLRELEVARGGVDREIKAMVSQAVAISAYTQCRRVGQQYARETRGKK